MQILGSVQQRCPDYPGFDRLLHLTNEQCPSVPRASSGLDEGKALFDEGKYRQAQEVFENQQFANPDSTELKSWIQKAKDAQKEIEQLVQGLRTSVEGGDLGTAKDQLARLQKLAPKDDRIPELQKKLERLSSTRNAELEEDRNNDQDRLLKDAIRDYYAGNYDRADALLDQIAGRRSRHQALAYFYRGAVASAKYFFSGAKDQQEQARARDFFTKARQADKRFNPPRDWLSPKIMEIYDKTVAGS